jgi:hypothetical protein
MITRVTCILYRLIECIYLLTHYPLQLIIYMPINQLSNLILNSFLKVKRLLYQSIQSLDEIIICNSYIIHSLIHRDLPTFLVGC